MKCVAVLAGIAFLAACGGSSTSSTRFDFQRSTYPGICIVPLAAMQEGRMTSGNLERAPVSGIDNAVRAAADTATDTPFMMDWDTILGLASNGMGDDRDVVRYYLAYEITSSPTSNTCTVKVNVIEGLPFDPTRAPVAVFQASATIGEMHHAGFTIASEYECVDEAGYRVGNMIAASSFFAPGWSEGPPAHG